MHMPSPTLPLLALMLCSCSSPPEPPKVDEAQRRPVNAAAAISLQVCEGALQNTRIAASESSRAAAAAKATAVQLASQQQLLAAQALRADGPGNLVFSILFGHGDTHLVLSGREAAHLLDEARASAWIVLRGRTDGSTDSAAESRVARARSEAIKTFLVEAGVDPIRIRATWQPVGDNAADNTTDGGRRLNRRVEVELYRVAPRLASLAAGPQL